MPIFSDASTGLFAIALFGFTGSLHCAGMCGPIAASTARRGLTRDMILYHVSRALSYTVIGFALGLASATILSQFPKAQAQHSQYVGVILGSLMIFYAFVEVLGRFFKLSIFKIKPQFFSRFRRVLPLSEPVVLGIATALLPCGFLYAAFLQAAVLAHPIYSGLGMLIFAICTGPALGFGGVLFIWLQRKAPGLTPWVSALALTAAGLGIIMRST